MRTSGGLAVTASGAILLLAVNIPLVPVADAEDGPRAALDALLDSGMSQQ